MSPHVKYSQFGQPSKRSLIGTVLRPLRGRTYLTDDVTGDIASLNPRLISTTPRMINSRGAGDVSTGVVGRPCGRLIVRRCRGESYMTPEAWTSSRRLLPPLCGTRCCYI